MMPILIDNMRLFLAGRGIEMRNLIGDEVHRWRDLLGESGACVRLYGKHEARPGRKMGHVTRIVGP